MRFRLRRRSSSSNPRFGELFDRQSQQSPILCHQTLLGDSSWPDYIHAYENWTAANPEQLDLGTLFSADFLFAGVLKQTPDSGLILNEEEIDPLNGAISFSILPLFDSSTVRIELPALIESRRPSRIRQLRKRLARLNGSLWSSSDIRKAIGPLYANLGLTPQVLVLPRNTAIQIVEGPRIASIVLPADQVPARDVDRLLWELLDTAHFRMTREGSASSISSAILSYADRRRAVCDSVPASGAAASDLAARVHLDDRTKYADGRKPVCRSARAKATKKSRHICGRDSRYKPGQGFSLLGSRAVVVHESVWRRSVWNFGIGQLFSQDVSFSASCERIHLHGSQPRISTASTWTNKAPVNSATLQWEPWRGLDGNTITVPVGSQPRGGAEPNLNTITTWLPVRAQRPHLRIPCRGRPSRPAS